MGEREALARSIIARVRAVGRVRSPDAALITRVAAGPDEGAGTGG